MSDTVIDVHESNKKRKVIEIQTDTSDQSRNNNNRMEDIMISDTEVGTVIGSIASALQLEPSYYDAAYSYLTYKGVSNADALLALLQELTVEQRRACSDVISVLAPLPYILADKNMAATVKAYSVDAIKDIIRVRHGGASFVTSFVTRLIGDSAVLGVQYNATSRLFVIGRGCYGTYDLDVFKPAAARANYCAIKKVANIGFTGDVSDVLAARLAALRVRVTTDGRVVAHPAPATVELKHGILRYADLAFVSRASKLFADNVDKYESNEAGIMSVFAQLKLTDRDKAGADVIQNEMKTELAKLQTDIKQGGTIVDKVLRVVNCRQAYYSGVCGIINTTYPSPVMLFAPSSAQQAIYLKLIGENNLVDFTDSVKLNAIAAVADDSVLRTVLKDEGVNLVLRFGLVEAKPNTVFSRVVKLLKLRHYAKAQLLPLENGLLPNYCVRFSTNKDSAGFAVNDVLERVVTANVALILYRNHMQHAFQINTCAYDMLNAKESTYESPLFDAEICTRLLNEQQQLADINFEF